MRKTPGPNLWPSHLCVHIHTCEDVHTHTHKILLFSSDYTHLLPFLFFPLSQMWQPRLKEFVVNVGNDGKAAEPASNQVFLTADESLLVHCPQLFPVHGRCIPGTPTSTRENPLLLCLAVRLQRFPVTLS